MFLTASLSFYEVRAQFDRNAEDRSVIMNLIYQFCIAFIISTNLKPCLNFAIYSPFYS